MKLFVSSPKFLPQASMTLYPKLILEALAHVRYPGTGIDVVSSNMVEDNIRIEGDKVSFSLVFDKQNDPFAKSLVKACEQAIHTYIGEDVEIAGNISVKFKEAPKPVEEKPLKGVKHVCDVGSGLITVTSQKFLVFCHNCELIRYECD